MGGLGIVPFIKHLLSVGKCWVLSINVIEYFQFDEGGNFISICEITMSHDNLTPCQCQIATLNCSDIVGE